MGCSESGAPLPVSKAEFLEWRSPRRGSGNPELLTNPVWVWIIENELNAYLANDEMGGPSAFDAGPCFSAERFGQSETELPDGRLIRIAGEHEDFYDPDFFIYNDVFVRHPDGRLEIYGYDEASFPPTDSHSATLVGEEIWLIGSIGYEGARRVGSTQVLNLDITTMKVVAVTTTGELPGWIHQHEARLEKDGKSIVIAGGLIDDGNDFVENIDEWELDLASHVWKRLTKRTWARWILTRENGKMNDLWEARQAEWEKKLGRLLIERDEDIPQREFDLTILEQLYSPGVSHEKVSRGDDDDDYNVYRIKIDGVVVRYLEDSHQVALTVEGDLPATIVEALVSDLKGKLSALEGVAYSARNLTNYP